MSNRFRAVAAEFIGTFFLLFGGTSAALGNALHGFGDSAGVIIPLAFGLSLVIAIFAVGHISGAHFNPAVTLAFAIGKRFAWADVPGYMIAQVLGATAASLVLYACFGGAAGFTTAPTVPGDSPLGAVMVYEFIGTFILMFVITGVATDTRIQGVPAGLAIGFTVAALALGTGWVSGGSFNPARTLGPALVGGVYDSLWIYLVFPTLGALAGHFGYEFVRGEHPTLDEPQVMVDTTLS